MRTRMTLITIVLLAVVLLLGATSLARLSGQTAAARIDPGAGPALHSSLMQTTLSGRVYEGETGVEPPGSTPLSGVTVSLYCSSNAPDQGTLLLSTTTNSEGWYGLEAREVCEYYNIVETNPTGYTSVGATSVGGTVKTYDWIQYEYPLEGKTLTGNKFWDTGPTTETPPPPTPTWTPTGPVPPTVTPTPTTTGEPELQADLRINKSLEGTEPVAPGGEIEYRISVLNQGPYDAPNVVVLDWLPGEVTYNDSGSDHRCSLVSEQRPHEVHCELGDLAPEGSDDVVVRAQVDEGICHPIHNLAEVWSDAPDLNPANNVAELDTQVGPCGGPTPTPTPTTTGEPELQADLRINKSLEGTEPVAPGGEIEYRISVLNQGPYDAPNVVVLDWLPGEVTYNDSGSDHRCSLVSEQRPHEVHCELGDLAPEGSDDVVVRAQVDEGICHPIHNLAEVWSDAPDLNPANNVAELDTQVGPCGGPTPTPTPTATPTVTLTPTATPTGEVAREWVVNTTADHDDGECQPLDVGDCTLREAMRIANEQAGPDTIVFDIPTDDPGYNSDDGTWVIEPQSALPTIADSGTTIDGSGVEGGGTHSGAVPLAAGPAGCKYPVIVAVLHTAPPGLVLTSSYGTLQAMHISTGSFTSVTIKGQQAHHNTVRCNIITSWMQNWQGWGVEISGGAYDNLIDANTIHERAGGISIRSGAHHNRLTANWVGSIAAGKKPNKGYGVEIVDGAHHNTVGHASDSSKGNVISGNDWGGVVIGGYPEANYNVVANNRIGIHPTSETPLPNGGAGVDLMGHDNTIGPSNVIAYNQSGGVALYGGAYNAHPGAGTNKVTKNSIFDNKWKGIHNPLTEPPAVQSVSSTKVEGTTKPKCSGCTVEIFTNPSHTPTKPAQGKTYLGWAQTQSDGTWNWTGTVPSMSWVTATLTKNSDTSEFSTPVRVTLQIAAIAKNWPDAVGTIPDYIVKLLKKKDSGQGAAARVEPRSGGTFIELEDREEEYEEVDCATAGSDGTFVLADNQSATLQPPYRLVMADPRYRVVSAGSASGGEVLPDGSILFMEVEPRLYGENTFYLEEVTPQQRVVNTMTDHDDGGCDSLASGDCTLREAINAANEQEGPDTILFDIPESDLSFEDGQWTIQPDTALPDLTSDGLVIGACTEQPFVVLDGSLTPPGSSAYTLKGASQKIEGMVLSNWPANGVRITGAEAHYNSVACNQIVDNLGDGVLIEAGAHRNTVGGPSGSNLISGNSGDGIGITGTGTDHNWLIGNTIGTDEAGTVARGNTGHGVHISGGARYNDVGGELATDGNVIAANGRSGVMIEGSDTAINRVGANLIGIAADGGMPLGNGHHGVGIYDGAVLNQVGSRVLEPNVIGANGWSGVAIVESNTNEVNGNIIGTDASGVKNLGNGYHGVHVVDGSDNSIISNTIAHNGADGVRVDGTTAVRNRITVNAITANGAKAIELVNGGNTELARPVITSVTGGSVSGTACAVCTVEVFSDPADQGQYVHSPPYAFADSSGNWSWTGTITGTNLTATATDGAGNTSELSMPYTGACCRIYLPIILKSYP